MRKKLCLKTIASASFFLTTLLLTNSANAQTTDGDFKPSGKVWGQVFADYLYKGHSDSLNRGNGQYAGATNYPKNINEFQFRRVYLGYTYDISPKLTADILLSAENNNAGQDVLTDNKLSPFIKYADLRIKNIYPGADLVVGQFATPAFGQSSEPLWGYRSVEKTIADFHGTPSYDMGAAIQGKFDPKTGNFGYNVMIGNGTSAKAVTNNKVPSAKWFYGDLWAKFLDKKLCFDLYSDFMLVQRIPSTAVTPTVNQSRNMIKLVVGYTTSKFTVGAEAFINTFNDQLVGTTTTASKDTLSPVAEGISVFVRGSIVTGKLGFFARLDALNPNNKVDSSKYTAYAPLGGTTIGSYSTSSPFYKEQFISAGLDFTPDKNVHIMPNIWWNGYSNQVGASKSNYDLVYRVTFAYTFNK